MIRLTHFFFAASLAGAPALLGAQRRTTVRISPIVGWMEQRTELLTMPYAGSADSARTYRLTNAPVFGISAERAALAGMKLRASVLYSRPQLAQQVSDGTESCGGDCYRVRHRNVPLAGASVWMATADAVIPGPRLAIVQPYALFGVGAKRFGFAQDEVPTEVAREFARDQISAVAQLGAGFNVRLPRGIELATQFSFYSSRFRHDDTAGQEGGDVPYKLDAVRSLSLRIPLGGKRTAVW